MGLISPNVGKEARIPGEVRIQTSQVFGLVFIEAGSLGGRLPMRNIQ